MLSLTIPTVNPATEQVRVEYLASLIDTGVTVGRERAAPLTVLLHLDGVAATEGEGKLSATFHSALSPS